ncbi:hypothetical protein Tco_1071310 [Tanacetum coccineum]
MNTLHHSHTILYLYESFFLGFKAGLPGKITFMIFSKQYTTKKDIDSGSQLATRVGVEMAVSFSAIEGGDDSGHEGELGAVGLERELNRDAADVGYRCRSETLVGQGSAVIVTADAGFPSTDVSSFVDGLRKRPVADPHALCEKFHIPDNVHLELPGLNDRIRSSPTCKIGLSFITAVKASHFEILCRVHGIVSTVDSLKHWNDHFFWVDASVFPLVVPWHSNKMLRKDPHLTPAEFNADVCDFLANNLAPFRKFLEPFLCFVGISRYYDLDKNCYPTFWTDDEEMDLFAFINHADPTKVQIREREVREGEGVGYDNVNEEVGDAAMADQIKKSDHATQDEGANIVHIEDEILVSASKRAKGSRMKRKAAGGASDSSLPPKKLWADYGTSGVGASTGEKSVAALQSLLEGSTLVVEVGVTATATVPCITSSVTPTPERGVDGPAESISRIGLRTRHPAERFMISLDSSHDSNANAADDKVFSVIRSLILDPLIMTTTAATMVVIVITVIPVPRAGNELVYPTPFADFASIGDVNPDIAGPSHPAGTELSSDTFSMILDMDTDGLQLTYVPKWTVINDSSLDDPDIFRSVVDHLTPPMLFSQLCIMDYDQLLAEFNVGAARQTCLGSKERDAEIASLKAKLSLKEVEAAEAIRLCGKIATVEAAEAAWASELDGLKERNATLEGQLSCEELSIKVASLESNKDKLIDQVSTLKSTCSRLRDEVMGYKLFKKQIKAVQDEQVKVLSDKVVGLDKDLIEMALHLDEEFYPRYLTTIAGRRWILSRGLRQVVMKCLQLPGYLAALREAIGRAIDNDIHDGLAAANYVAAMNALRPAAETLDASQLQPSPDQLMLPIHRLEDQVVIGETSLSFSLDLAHDRVQRLRGNTASRRLSISDALVPLIGALSAENLVGEASTFGVLATSTTTALSTTFVQASTVPLVLMVDHEVSGAGPATGVPSPSKIVFEKEELKTTPEHTTTS